EAAAGLAAGAPREAPRAWEEPETPEEDAEELEATDDEEVLEVYDDDLEEEESDEDEDEDEEEEDDEAGDEDDEDDEDDERALEHEAAAEEPATEPPAHEEALVDPYGIEGEEERPRAVVDVPEAPEPEADAGRTDEERDARIEEIEQAMSNFGRRREHYGGGQRYGRKSRRGR
ncbi:MAG TPA: hypothetical protein VFV62_06735, partial [Gaiellaceae bacterium]|nr:hypothetical protein [Gaiellaceae bacterium]